MSRIIQNTSLYTIGNIVPQAAGFFLLPIYTHYLTPADYGIVSSMQVLNSFLAVIFTLSIERSIYRLYWDHKTEQDKKNYLGSIAVALVAIATMALALMFLFQEIFGLIYKSIPFYPYYVYAILTSYFSVFALVPKMYLQLNQKAGSFVIVSLMQFFFSVVFILWFVVGLSEGAAGMLKGQMIGCGILLPVFICMGFKIINVTFKSTIMRESLKFSLPMIPTLLSAWVLNLSDRIFIERYFSLADVGIYSLGSKIAGLVLILSSAFNMAYEPYFYEVANSADQPRSRNKLYSVNNVFVMIILVICFLISFFAKEIIVIFLDSRYSESYKVIPIMTFAYFILQSGELMNRSIYQEKKTIAIMFISISGAVFNIGLNFLLVPILGVYGAAYSAVLSFMGLFIVKYWYARKCYFIDYDWKYVLIGLLIAVPIVATIYITDINIYISMVLKSACVVCISLFLYMRYGAHIKAKLRANQIA